MKLISVDFQGWPVAALNLYEILKLIGFVVEDDKLVLELNETTKKIISAYPRILEDDGMGYGVKPMYVSEIDTEIYEDEICGTPTPMFNVFRESDNSDKIKNKKDFEEYFNE